MTVVLLGESEKALEALLAIEGVQNAREVESKTRERVTLEVEFVGDDAAVSRLLARLTAKGLPVVHFGQDTRDLEEVFMRATKGIVS